VDTPPPGTHIGLRDRLDVGTRISGLESLPSVDLGEMRRVYGRLVELATREAPRPELDAGYRIVWGRGEERGWLDLAAHSSSFAVIGRHSRADLVLPRDEQVSLRHLLATAYLLPRESGGRPDVALRLLDLRTTLSFLLDDGSARRSIVATGPVCLRLASYVLAAFPVHDGNLEIAGDAQIDSMAVPCSAVRDELMPPSKTSRPWRTSEIAVMAQPSEISQIVARSTDDPRRARVTIEREGRGTTVAISEAELARGVLIGRAEKCLDQGLRSLLTGRVSRVHLLLLAEGEQVTAYDLCTMNGTRREGERVRSTLLDDGGTRLLLGSRRDGVILRWQRSARSEPLGPYR